MNAAACRLKTNLPYLPKFESNSRTPGADAASTIFIRNSGRKTTLQKSPVFVGARQNQHKVTFAANLPSDVSLHFDGMSAIIFPIVSITLSHLAKWSACPTTIDPLGSCLRWRHLAEFESMRS